MRHVDWTLSVLLAGLFAGWTALVAGGVYAIIHDTAHVTTGGGMVAVGAGFLLWLTPIVVMVVDA